MAAIEGEHPVRLRGPQTNRQEQQQTPPGWPAEPQHEKVHTPPRRHACSQARELRAIAAKAQFSPAQQTRRLCNRCLALLHHGVNGPLLATPDPPLDPGPKSAQFGPIGSKPLPPDRRNFSCWNTFPYDLARSTSRFACSTTRTGGGGFPFRYPTRIHRTAPKSKAFLSDEQS